MADIHGFLKVSRKKTAYRPVCERIKDCREVAVLRSTEASVEQASRCMDCGTPFCHWGCPVGNYIPEWNDLVFAGRWAKAYELLSATNNFPEVTGRICPNPCEFSCVLGVNNDPVTIRENELAIIEYAFKSGLVKPEPPKKRTGKTVAVVGSGPAGLACADQLNKAGHKVTVFEKDEKAGGIMRYGIPDFKLEKSVLDRRLNILSAEGIEFKTGIEAGKDIPASGLLKDFDAVVLAGGSRQPRDLAVPGRDLAGIHFAMDYLTQYNRVNAGQKLDGGKQICAKGKKVVVIGGGDTGADCMGVAHRQGAACITQIELMPKPAECRTESFPWPKYPMILKTSTSHEEGGERKWSVLTKRFIGEEGEVRKLSCVLVEFGPKDQKGCPVMREVPGSDFEIEADLVLLALGFLHPQAEGLLKQLGVELDSRGNVKTGPDYSASVKNVFSCGDMRRGQSLIVWAISEGRRSAHFIDRYLQGASRLPLI